MRMHCFWFEKDENECLWFLVSDWKDMDMEDKIVRVVDVTKMKLK